ncbi:MAG: hypothetical protein R6U93_05830 [Dehalococcoidia bacterium]|jgi:hypothetical protein
MKRLLFLIPILALILLPMGCADLDLEGRLGEMIEELIEEILDDARATYMIKVCGDTGLNFTGEYEVLRAAFDSDTWVNFSSNSTAVEGQVPEEYTVLDAITVTGRFQKQSGGNETLSVEIWRGGDLIGSSNTTFPWGTVVVTAYPS